MPRQAEKGKSTLLARFTRPERRRLQVEVTASLYYDLETIMRYVKHETGTQPLLDEIVETMLPIKLESSLKLKPGIVALSESKRVRNRQCMNLKMRCRKRLQLRISGYYRA